MEDTNHIVIIIPIKGNCSRKEIVRSIVHDNETKEHEPKEHRSRSYNKPPIGNIQHIYDIPLMPDFSMGTQAPRVVIDNWNFN